MTVAASTIPARYNCDSLTTAFTFNFGVKTTSEVKVVLTSSAGLETVLTETTHYTVSATNSDYSSGGTVTTVATYAAGNTLTIKPNIPLTQASDFVEGMPTLYGTFEDALDKMTRLIQQLHEEIGRAPRFKESSEYSDLSLPDPVAGAYLRTKTDLTGYDNVVSITANGATQATAGFYSSTMTTDEVVTVTGTLMVCDLDPNGADRNFDLTVPGDYVAIVHNRGPNLITFDQLGIAHSLGSGDTHTFIYNSTAAAWRS